MRRLLTTVALGLLVASPTLVRAENVMDKMMADMKSCQVCSAMADKPELMEHSTWESHKIPNGMLCLMTVPKEQKSEFEAVYADMMKKVEQVKADDAAGKEVHVCEFCKTMGDLEKAGAKHLEITTETGAISMMTSDDPSVVQKIHAAADKAIEMQKQMKDAMASTH